MKPESLIIKQLVPAEKGWTCESYNSINPGKFVIYFWAVVEDKDLGTIILPVRHFNENGGGYMGIDEECEIISPQ